MRFIPFVLGLAAVGVLGFVIDAQSRVPVRYPDVPPKLQRIFAVGRVEGLTQEIKLRPQLSGRIDEIPVHEGQWVEKGDVLLRLDDETYRCETALAGAKLDVAKAQLEQLQAGARPEEREAAAALHRAKLADLEKAELLYDRMQNLRGSQAVAQQEVDNSRMAVEALKAEATAFQARYALLEAPPRADEVRMDQAQVRAAEAALHEAQVQLDRANLRSPIRGQVLQINGRLGEIAGPASTRPAVILADTSKFRVRAFLEELDAPRIRLGMPATVTADGLPGHEFHGRVTGFSLLMDRKELWSDQPSERFDTKTREVWIDLEDAKDLVVGLRVDVAIDLASGEQPTVRAAKRLPGGKFPGGRIANPSYGHSAGRTIPAARPNGDIRPLPGVQK